MDNARAAQAASITAKPAELEASAAVSADGKLQVVDLSAFFAARLRCAISTSTSRPIGSPRSSVRRDAASRPWCDVSTGCMRCSAGNHAEGQVWLDGEDIYAPGVDPVQVRRRIGMVFQKATPFPTMSIEDNVPPVCGSTAGAWAAPNAIGSSSRACVRRRCGTRSRTAARPGRQPVGRAATAPVYCARAGGRARGPADGRAVLRAGSDFHRAYRGTDAGAEGVLYDRASSRTTCSRRRGPPTTPPFCMPAT